MQKLYFFLFALFSLATVNAQTVQEIDTFNTQLRAQFYYDGIGVNDIWGYAAPDGTEYALVGLGNGLSIVSLANPDSIYEVQRIPGEQTTWRDIKTMNDHAYIVSDATSEGMLIVDLSTLPEEVTYRYLNLPHPSGSVLNRAHNIFIDTTQGHAYLAGSNLNGRGMVIYDVASQPDTAIFLADAPQTYAHDVFVQDGRMYASEIYIGSLTIYDVSDLNNITLIGSALTPFDFTHNAWTTVDQNYIFTTDERANAPVAAYDISDETSPVLIDEFRPERSLGAGTIPHNVHVLDEYLLISYYTDGLEIADASVPDNIIEVGYFDSWPSDELGFNGNWGAYPFLPSGLVLMTDRTYGLHVVEVDYKRGARLHGKITDATTGEVINNVNVSITGPDEKETMTDASGDYKTGSAIGGAYTANFSVFGYDNLSVPVTLENGVITVLDTSMVATSVGTTEFVGEAGIELDIYPNPTSDQFQLNYDIATIAGKNLTLQVFDIQGKLLINQSLTGLNQFGRDLSSGTYFLQVLNEGKVAYATKVVKQ